MGVCVPLRSTLNNCFSCGITFDDEKETTYDFGVSLLHSGSCALGFGVSLEPSNRPTRGMVVRDNDTRDESSNLRMSTS